MAAEITICHSSTEFSTHNCSLREHALSKNVSILYVILDHNACYTHTSLTISTALLLALNGTFSNVGGEFQLLINDFTGLLKSGNSVMGGRLPLTRWFDGPVIIIC